MTISGQLTQALSPRGQARRLMSAGYVPVAPACGDCQYSDEQPQGIFCRRHQAAVEDNARCLHWQPGAQWLRANADVAGCYSDPAQRLSPSERAYLHHDHPLF